MAVHTHKLTICRNTETPRWRRDSINHAGRLARFYWVGPIFVRWQVR